MAPDERSGEPVAASAARPAPGAQPAPRAGPAPWLRIAGIGLAAVAAVVIVIVLAWQLALARVPQHRATLERLVRAQTGLDMRFEELGLRWGWYGPEAVFRRVELGEPGRSNVLLRAPQLVVGFDAWGTVQSGQLQPGRITLVAPDIDLARPPPRGERPADAAGRPDSAARARLLRRWRGGRIDVQGGTLRIADPSGAARTVSLHLRRASMRRAGQTLAASGLVILPERMGRTVTFTLQLEGDLEMPASLSGTVRLEGRRLAFAGWRELFGPGSAVGRYLPLAGGGDATVHLELAAGRVLRAEGELRAEEVALAPAAPAAAPGAEPDAVPRDLRLGYVRGEWSAERAASDWRVSVRGLRMGPQGREAPRAALAFVLDGASGRARGELDVAPVEALAALARWLAPDLELSGVELAGTARDVRFEWHARGAPGERLALTALLEELSIAARSGSFSLSGLSARVTGRDAALAADVEATDARLVLARAPEEPITGLRLGGRLEIGLVQPGQWQLASERLLLGHEIGELELAGSLREGEADGEPLLALTGRLQSAEVSALRRHMAEPLMRALGAPAARLEAGRIEDARFALEGRWSELALAAPGTTFRGSLGLHEAALAADERWPAVEALEGRIEWAGPAVTAAIAQARAGPFAVGAARAEWRTDGAPVLRVTGRAAARLEEAAAWLQERPALQAHVPLARALAARGEALFELDVSMTPPRSTRAAPPQPRVRLAVSFEDAQLDLLPGLPALQAARGALAFDAGRLQRSTVSGSWLGGPATLRLAGHRDGGQPGLAVQAEGIFDARELARVSGLGEPGQLEGRSSWKGELAWRTTTAADAPPHWSARVQSSLIGVASRLPAPLGKPAGASLPLMLELGGEGAAVTLRAQAGERASVQLALRQEEGAGGFHIERGALRFGSDAAALPAEPELRVDGRLERFDLPAWLAAWQAARERPADDAPAVPVHAELTAAELLVAGRRFGPAEVRAQPAEGGYELVLAAEGLEGQVSWPLQRSPEQPVRVRLTRLAIPPRDAAEAAAEPLGALGAVLGGPAQLEIERLQWAQLALGRLTGRLESTEAGLALEQLRLSRQAHDLTGELRCAAAAATCRASLQLDVRDAAATLRDFGFREDLTAGRGSVQAELGWQPAAEQPWLATLTGRLSLHLTEGTMRAAAPRAGRPFPLLIVPALLGRAAEPAEPGAGVAAALESELAFGRLDADFELQDGEARTANLHFDGQAEILVRGRAGLVSRDYDLTATVLRGEERLPKPVRRFGSAPRVAAAWMTLRDLLAGSSTRSRAVLHLHGSWDEPEIELLGAATPPREEPVAAAGRSRGTERE